MKFFSITLVTTSAFIMCFAHSSVLAANHPERVNRLIKTLTSLPIAQTPGQTSGKILISLVKLNPKKTTMYYRLAYERSYFDPIFYTYALKAGNLIRKSDLSEKQKSRILKKLSFVGY